MAACTPGLRTTTPGSSVQPGTYQVIICRETCDAGNPERNLVHGRIVIESDRYDIAEIRDPARSYLLRREPYLVIGDAGREPNACFVLTSTRRAITYAGITPVSMTRWKSDSTGTISLPLYHSPDAGYIATVSIRGRELNGRGRSWGSGTGDGPIPSDSIIGRRIGPPDREICIREAEARDAARRRQQSP